MAQVYDCIIVGCGPAGLSAALNLKIRNKSFIILGTKDCSQWLAKAERVDNYLGFPAISGSELRDRFFDHIHQQGIEQMDARVSAIYGGEGTFSLMAGRDSYQSRTVIVATGVHVERLLPGENELLGRGVSYCATCDGPLYKGKKVALIDYTQGEAWDEALFLSELAAKVYYLSATSQNGAKAFTPSTNPKNMEFPQGKVLALKGTESIASLQTDDQEIPIDGVFILRETMKAENLLPGLETRDGAIIVDAHMRTNMPGVFAGGDCTGKPYQLAKAVGQGAIAALSAVSFLDEQQHTPAKGL
ncbi:NAD(P)/FAD-dependent oxidoreductase [Heliobacterium chlorum]|uniref:NAD(P)/FAD-dependent oxidoreductase n=1 Tax=Heliobacterium chlorum TaxID=2698 RepID=A0ABR7SYV0_HELCL|nr:NAD(P)/FAD-dependent oxidoreductase [Heliobacterium chlorum]